MSFFKNWLPKMPRQELEPLNVSRAYQCKNRFAMLGTIGSGKSTINGLLWLTAQTKNCDEPNFRCRILENLSNIRDDASKLRDGHFPPKTIPYNNFASEAGLLLSEKSMIGEKTIQVPVCDAAGEDLIRLIQQVVYNNDLSREMFSASRKIVDYVLRSDGYIIALPASRAKLGGGAQLEKEAGDNLSEDPDVNLSRILETVLAYKEKNKGNKIKGIAIMITKWDLVEPIIARKGIDITNQQGLKEFMDLYFPDTSTQMKAVGLHNVRFFPSFVELEYNELGDGERWPDGTFKIKVNNDKRKPSYAEQSYMDLLNYLLSFAK